MIDMDTHLAIKVRGVRKTFISGFFRKRRKEALRGIDLEVPRGVFWGILGPNGAGKTTFLSILSNLLLPEAGEVSILGKDIRTHGPELFSKINLSSGNANFLWSLTVQENLQYYAMLYGLSGKARRAKLDALMDIFGLKAFARVRFDELSTGTKQKLSLAKALINDPELLLLDEPTVGLDPDAALRIREAIRRRHKENRTTILMTTHNMREAEALCEKIAFLKEGVIKAFGTPHDLKRELGLGDMIRLSFQGNPNTNRLKSLQGVFHLRMDGTECHITVDDHRKRLPEILESLVTEDIRVQDVQIKESDLEDVFIAFAR